MEKSTILTYRLKGIPNYYALGDVKELICRSLGLDGSKVRVRSLAQNPLNDKDKIATISVSDQQSNLVEQHSTKSWVFEDPHQSYEGLSDFYCLDTHFHGFTPLHRSSDELCDTE